MMASSTRLTNQDTTLMPPPPKETPPPLPSAPPLSDAMQELPPGLKSDVEVQAPPEPNLAKKIALWHERTKIIAGSVLAYENFQTCEEEYTKAVKVTESQLFATLPDADQKRLTAQVDALLLQHNSAHHKYEKLRDRLIRSSSWPISPIQPSEEKEKHLALVKNVAELGDAVSRVKTALEDLGQLSKPPPQRLFLPGNDSDEEEENQSRHRSSASTSRITSHPNKKRRHEDDLDDDTRPPRPTEDMPTEKELEDYHKKLAVCQEQLANLWNHCHQRDADQRQDFERELNDRIAKIRQQRAKEQQDREREQEKQETARQAVLKEMDERVSRDGEDLGTITTDMASMLLTVDLLQAELERETEARNESFQRMLQVEQQLDSYTAAQQANTATLESMQAALDASIARSPSSPRLPEVPALSYLVESLEQPLIESLRMTIRPVLEELRGDVEQLVKEKNGQLFATVWEKISQTLRVLSLIHKRLDAARPASQSQAQ